MVQRREQRLVQEFVPQTTVETFDEGILGRIAGRNAMAVTLAVIGDGHARAKYADALAENLIRLAQLADVPGP